MPLEIQLKMKTSELKPTEFNPYYGKYIARVGAIELIEGLQVSLETTLDFIQAIPEDKLAYRYAKDKWTIKEIVQHIIDTERVFCYRALRFARMDKTPLPGFNQDDYIAPSHANSRSISNLIAEYIAVRQASISLFSNLRDDMLKHIGEASHSPMSARACGFIIIGHEAHHCHVIKERYLK